MHSLFTRSVFFVFSLVLTVSAVWGQKLLMSDGDVVLRREESGVKPVFPDRVEAKSPSFRLERDFLELRAPLGPEPLIKEPLIKRTAHSRARSLRVLRETVFRECERHGVDPDLVFSVIWEESRGRLGALSPVGARGPMQLMPGTAARYGVRNPNDPEQAVRGGVAYLVWLLDHFGGNVSLALSSYNAGEGATEAYRTGRSLRLATGKIINPRGVVSRNGIPLYNETQGYVSRIAARYRLLKDLPR